MNSTWFKWTPDTHPFVTDGNPTSEVVLVVTTSGEFFACKYHHGGSWVTANEGKVVNIGNGAFWMYIPKVSGGSEQ